MHEGLDTGYSSWRSVLWSRWPSAGPPPHLDSEQDYTTAIHQLISVGAALDTAMVYWDVRPSNQFPTLEIRVADVPATPNDTVTYATLVRALVMTELSALNDDPAQGPPLSADTLRLATWRAARDGIAGHCLDPLGDTLITTWQAVERLVEHVTPALEILGEDTTITDALNALRTHGNGAQHQRRVLHDSGIHAVVDHIAARTTDQGT